MLRDGSGRSSGLKIAESSYRVPRVVTPNEGKKPKKKKFGSSLTLWTLETDKQPAYSTFYFVQFIPDWYGIPSSLRRRRPLYSCLLCVFMWSAADDWFVCEPTFNITIDVIPGSSCLVRQMDREKQNTLGKLQGGRILIFFCGHYFSSSTSLYVATVRRFLADEGPTMRACKTSERSSWISVVYFGCCSFGHSASVVSG